jgi:tetratricopeptide (TPR) repeat protein
MKPESQIMESILKRLEAGEVEEVRATARERLRKDRDDPEGWFLMGMVAQYKKNADYALECFERALYLEKAEKYHKAKGISHMGLFEFEEAAEELKKALEMNKDAESHFMLSIALMFLKDEEANEQMVEAYRINASKTKEMLKDFFDAFFKNDESIPKAEKEEMLKKLMG